MSRTTIEFPDTIPFCKTGFGLLQNTYGSGRLGVVTTHFGGLGKIFYLGPKPAKAPRTFFSIDPSSSYGRLFRHQILVNGDAYHLEFTDTRHFPFGYISHFRIESLGLSLRHRLTLLDHALIFSVEVLANPGGHRLAQRLEHHDYTSTPSIRPVERTASQWEAFPACEGWIQSFHDRTNDDYWTNLKSKERQRPNPVNLPNLNVDLRESITRIALFGDDGAYAMRSTYSGRLYFSGSEFTTGAKSCALLFGDAGTNFEQEALALRTSLAVLPTAGELAFRQRLDRQPAFDANDGVFESCLANVIPTVEALIPEGVPGGIRASSTNYWVWGWDTMISADVHLLGGRTKFVKDMLRLFRDTADVEYGYAHMFTSHMEVAMVQTPSAQCLYVVQLYNYLVHTGDLETTREFYPFAKEILQRNLATVNERGLGDGPTLFPDYPTFAGHNGHDISVFNNSLLYQGARSMEVLACVAGDDTSAAAARDLARLLETTFMETFWDREAGYFVDSVDSRSFAQRCSYPAHALIWQTTWLEDLVGKNLAACGRFQNENLRTPRGYLMYPRWDKGAFDGDGNQLAQIWQTHDVFVTRCLAADGNQDALEGWIDQCDWFWKQLTYIEGYSAQTVNDGGTLDQPGGKQAFGAKSIYSATLTGLAGIHFDTGGITLAEGIERTLKIARIAFRGKSLNFSLSGAGKYPALLTVNGTALHGTRKIPLGALNEFTDIVCERTNQRPAVPTILTLHGGEIHSITSTPEGLSAEVSGWGHLHLAYFSPYVPELVINGRPLASNYDKATGEGTALLEITGTKTVRLQIQPAAKLMAGKRNLVECAHASPASSLLHPEPITRGAR